jgi:hypothetical protein
MIPFVYDPMLQLRSGQIIQIDSEKMRVRAATISTSVFMLVVTRGIQGTVPVAHTRGTTSLIYGDRALFMVTGIPGERCEIVQTDSAGAILSNIPSLQMTREANNTFQLATALNRSENFYYRYRYLDPRNDIVPVVSKMRTFSSKGTGIGDGAVDIFSAIHESTSFQETNYSIDPLFVDGPNGNYELTVDSPSNQSNVLYAPEVFIFSKYQGREKVQEVKNFTTADITAAGGSITQILIML